MFNYGICIGSNNKGMVNKTKLFFPATEGYNFYIISYSDIYNNKYYSLLRINLYKEATEDNKFVLMTKEELINDEYIYFTSAKARIKKEKLEYKEFRNNIMEIIKYIDTKKSLNFNIEYVIN